MLHEQAFRLFIAKAFWITLIVPAATMAQVHNVALNKPAQQSSSHYNANRAVDGAKDTSSRTEYDSHPSWIVDLGDSFVIDLIRIFTTSSNNNINQDVHIALSVDGHTFTDVCSRTGPLPDNYTCQPWIMNLGRWVNLTSHADGATKLCLYEVEVMAYQTLDREKFTSVPSVKGTGSVIHTRPVVSDTQCAFLCTRNTNCVSVNVVNSNTGMECQLLGSNVYDDTNEEYTSFWKLH